MGPDDAQKYGEWLQAHPYAALLFSLALFAGIAVFTVISQRIRTVNQAVWLVVALSFLGGVINICIHQPQLGFAAVAGIAGIAALLFRRGFFQRTNDGNLVQNMQNVRRFFMYAFFLLTFLAVVALLVAFFRH